MAMSQSSRRTILFESTARAKRQLEVVGWMIRNQRGTPELAAKAFAQTRETLESLDRQTRAFNRAVREGAIEERPLPDIERR